LTGRRIVVDANILIRAVLGRRVGQLIASHADSARFFEHRGVRFESGREHLSDRLRRHAVFER
jgi:hypothetical protein